MLTHGWNQWGHRGDILSVLHTIKFKLWFKFGRLSLSAGYYLPTATLNFYESSSSLFPVVFHKHESDSNFKVAARVSDCIRHGQAGFAENRSRGD